MESSQTNVNSVWSDVWERESADAESVFYNRLFIEEYPIVRKYIPDTARLMLEIGSGSGRYGAAFARDLPNSRVCITDIVEESVRVAQRLVEKLRLTNAVVQKEDMFQLSFPDNSFDVVFCDAVIQHVDNPHEAMKEMLRVLVPGGRLIFSAVNRFNFHTLYKLFLRRVGKPYPYGYEKSYTHAEFAALINEAGGVFVAQDGWYVAYGLYRLKRFSAVFGFLGKILNRLVKAGDSVTGRWISRKFGFMILAVAGKPVRPAGME